MKIAFLASFVLVGVALAACGDNKPAQDPSTQPTTTATATATTTPDPTATGTSTAPAPTSTTP
jgi:hypothetical protein